MTPLHDIYEAFLSKISDYTYLNLSQTEIEEDLYGYLKSAIAKFYRCKNDLTIQTDGSGQKVFASTLTPFEIEILVTLMIVEYLKPQILSSEILKQSLSDKDFRIYSQANQLRELNLLYRMFRTEADKMITQYGYIGLDKEQL
jgi:hypothetical protein